MARETVDLLIKKASELITLQGTSRNSVRKEKMKNLKIIENGAVGVREGIIVAVGKTNKIEQHFKAEQVVDASGEIVMPGFVDSHTHLVFAGAREEEFELRLRGFSNLQISDRGGRILKTVNETRNASKEQLVEKAWNTLDVMLNHGTTTIDAKSGYGLTVKDETKCLEVVKELDKAHPVNVVSTFLGAHAVPPEYKDAADEYVELVVEEMIPKFSSGSLAEFCDVFCEEGFFNVHQSRRILQKGLEHELTPKIHAEEHTQLGGAELAAEVKAISADHLIHASKKGLKAMAREKVMAVLLPTASFSLRTGKYADARKIIELGIAIALGTDFNPSCWTENMQTAITLACHEMHLTPAEAITAATINAAHAVNRAEQVGSLEKGKKADIIILKIPNHKCLGYRFGVNLVDKVVKDGKIVAENWRQKSGKVNLEG